MITVGETGETIKLIVARRAGATAQTLKVSP